MDVDELVIDTPDGPVPLGTAQAVLGKVMATSLDRVPDEAQVELQRTLAGHLDALIAAARTARSGEHVLSGDTAIGAFRALVRQAVEDLQREWEQES